MLLHFQ
jgi:hypothetical protein